MREEGFAFDGMSGRVAFDRNGDREESTAFSVLESCQEPVENNCEVSSADCTRACLQTGLQPSFIRFCKTRRNQIKYN
jgi:hypothetical protein